MDKLLRATAHGGDIRIIAAETTEMVAEAVQTHNTMPTASAAYGRMLTAGALMGTFLKNEGDSITLQINGGGIAGGVLVTGRRDGRVKGYIVNPEADLPLNSSGKLDVSGIIGTEGQLTVIADYGLKEPYVSAVPIYTGEVAEDLAYYYTTSEQTPSAVALGVLVNVNGSIRKAGGFIFQMMPGAKEQVADILTYRLEETPSITTLLDEGKTIREILEYLFSDMDLEIHEELEPRLYCDCSQERVEKALLSIGRKDLEELYQDGKEEKMVCHFCNKTYHFKKADFQRLLENLK